MKDSSQFQSEKTIILEKIKKYKNIDTIVNILLIKIIFQYEMLSDCEPLISFHYTSYCDSFGIMDFENYFQ